MLDIIIPIYNNNRGLFRTLNSISIDTKNINIIVIDDHSEQENCLAIIDIFKPYFQIQYYCLPENRGPGIARQTGLNISSNPYIYFLDCGDTLYEPTALIKALSIIEDNKDYEMYLWDSLTENENELSSDIMTNSHNMIRGKIYQRDFIQKNNITFSSSSSYANEDIGFNLACRMIAEKICEIDDILDVWKFSGPSIVRKDDYAFYYKEQNIGLALNAEHVLEIAHHNNICYEKIIRFIYEIMASLSIYYFITSKEKPEYSAEAFAGCFYFYKEHFRNCSLKQIEWLNEAYYKALEEHMNTDRETLQKHIVSLNFINFLQQLELVFQINKN